MDFSLTPEQQAIRETVGRICAEFDDNYWLERDKSGEYPLDFHAAMAAGGWLGVAMPEEYGGAGLGVVEAALVMHTVAGSSGAMGAASSIHLNIFGPHPIVVFGTEEQKARWLPDLIAGRVKSCFAVTEPDAGLDTTNIRTKAVRDGDHYVVHGRKIWTSSAQVADKVLLLARTTPRDEGAKRTDGMSLFFTDLDRGGAVEVREIDKMGRKAVDSNELFIDGLRVPVEDRIGEEGRGFEYILHSLNPERILVGIEAVAIGQNAIARAAKYLGAEAGFKACTRAVMALGGMGYAKEFHVERLMREVMICRLAPVSPQLILCHIAERALGLPKSY